MFAFSDLKEKLACYLPQECIDEVTKAYRVAGKAHAGQKRYTGEPYISHPIEVARILAGLRMDAQCVIAAILHDVIEDSSIDKEAIASQFGSKVAELVDGVSKLKNISFETRELAQAENFRKMMLAMARDIRVILIKLADRLHNMRTLGAMPSEKRRRIALETLEIYAPIAHRLGINHMRVEFEDLGFSALYPVRYRVLKEFVRHVRGNRKVLVQNIEQELQNKLVAQGLQHAIVWGREKHLYSLYQKMHRKRLSFSEVMDIYAFRVIVKKIEECYLALGVIHSTYRPIAKRFKDYIAIPKANGYQSLHTTVIGLHGVPIEVQIRTQEMEHLAENGVAAHWLYKSEEPEIEKVHTRAWLQDLLEIQKSTRSSIEFVENVKEDLFSDDVYVFTPKGSILSLPQGATPVDFAYAVHTDIGNSCVACKIDRRLAPLSTRLKSGQTVEIVTQNGTHPDPAWLSFVATAKARSNLRHWLRNQQKLEARTLGENLLNNALFTSAQYTLKDIEPAFFEALKREMHYESLPDLYEEIGFGKRMASLVAQRLLSYLVLPTTGTFSVERKEYLTIKGTEGFIVHYATCCYPIPGDLIVGIFIPDQGVVVHREACQKAAKYQKSTQSECINVQWEEDIQIEFKVPIVLEVLNRRGVFAALSTAIAESHADIVNVQVDERDARHYIVHFIVTVFHRQHLARVMQKLRTVKEVTRIARGQK